MADILTRREARQQAKQNRGYNRGQFQLAMANAKNALRNNSDLRGRELRQTARRMVAGEPQTHTPTILGNTTTPVIETSPLNGISELKPLQSRSPKYTNGQDLTSLGSFNDAFGTARKAGLKTFMWNGKPIAVKVAKPKQSSAVPTVTLETSASLLPQLPETEIPIDKTNVAIPNIPVAESENIVVKPIAIRGDNPATNISRNIGGTLKPTVTANPRKDIDLYRKQLMDV